MFFGWLILYKKYIISHYMSLDVCLFLDLSMIFSDMLFFSDGIALFLASEFLPVLQFPFLGQNSIIFRNVIYTELILTKNVIKTVINISIIWFHLKRRLSKLCRLWINFYISLFFVNFLMMKFVFVKEIDLIQLFTLKLLRLNQWVNKAWLCG